VHFQARAGTVFDLGIFREFDPAGVGRNDIKGLGVQKRGGFPVFEIIGGRGGREKEGILAALGSQSKPLFTAEDVDVLGIARALGLGLDAFGDVLAVNSSEAAA
jgi:hypothetical protein